MVYRIDSAACQDLERSSRLEWMLANGIGGFSMGTVSGINTRRYHGHLVAATHPPTQRTLLLAGVEAAMASEGAPVWLSANQYPGVVCPEGYRLLESFETDGVSARWTYRSGKLSASKHLTLHRNASACTLEYKNLSAKAVLLALRPLIAHRSYHGEFREQLGYPADLQFPRSETLAGHEGLRLVISHPGAQRLPVQGWYYRFEHQRDLERGLEAREDLYCPCELRYELLPGESAMLTASEGAAAKPILVELSGDGDPLCEAARPFLVRGGGRTSIIAGYPWFTDWGRDTMIALQGVCLSTGRIAEARRILEAYASQMRQGLIPNRFTDTGAEPEYNTADATLWFANAVYLTLRARWSRPFAARMLEVLEDSFRWHVSGTFHGIVLDDDDGLLMQGEPGMQLTWMDVRIDGWVVTPRHGKPVEIAGLWVNFLRILEWLARKLGKDGGSYGELAAKAEASFQRKFWCASRGHYFDTVDPYDASLRPNQVIAMALPFGPGKGQQALEALKAVERELLTPYGLRTLGPNEPGYRGRFKGPLRELDASYHQGTAWPWLLGPYASAVLKLTGDKRRARKALSKAMEMLEEYGLGGIAECYDGDAPQSPGGCPWQAWSAAEILRAWEETAE